MQCIVFFYYFM